MPTVEIARANGAIVFRLAEGNVDYDGMFDFAPLGLDPAGLPLLDSRVNVVAYGKALHHALYSHTAVGPQLGQLFGQQGANEAILRFLIVAAEAEQYRWETLCDDNDRFLAINRTCSLNRIAIAGTAPQNEELRVFAGPIKMAAFLSPSGVSSLSEFECVTTAVKNAREIGVDLQARVYLGEQGLLDDALAYIARGELPGVEAFPIPWDAIAMENELKTYPPQIVHFFCHGRIQETVSLFEFATINDNDVEAQIGSVQISVERLERVLESIGTVWMTVLNSCSSAEQAKPRLFSMAHQLAKSASPVTIGMAEPIDQGDATLFAESFYPPAFQAIAQVTAGLVPGTVVTVDFGPALRKAREALFDAAQNDIEKSGSTNGFGRWCLPVIYLRDPPLKITSSADPNMKRRIDMVAQALRNLPGDTPLELRDQLRKLLDKDPAVPPALQPDRFGNLP